MDITKYKFWKNRQQFGRVSTLKRMIKKRYERIEQNKSELNKLKIELSFRQKEIQKLTDTFNPKVYFMKKRNRSYYYWRGRVRFWNKNYDFHLGKEEYFKSRSEDFWTEYCKKEFRKRLTQKEIEDYLGSFRKVRRSVSKK